MKKFVLTIFGLLVVVGALGGVKGAQIGAMIAAAEQAGPPPESVTVAPAQAEVWTASLDAVGTTVAVQGVTIAPEVSGIVNRLAFESGQDVRAQQVLLSMDASVEVAELASAEAEAELAKVNLRRAAALREKSVNTPAELDAAKATARQAQARVQSLKASIAKKTIRAPFTGRLGIRQVNLGQILSPGTPIVTLQALEKLYVDFALPQRRLSSLGPGMTVEVTADAFGGQLWSGKIDTIDPSIDASTRNVQVRAVVENAERALRPGMFVDVRVVLPTERELVTVPSTAILFAPYGDSVFVVEDSPTEGKGDDLKVVRQVFVRLGERRGDLVEIRSGLVAGQSVVTTGAFKLRNGASVVINNDLAPEVSIDPNPEDS